MVDRKDVKGLARFISSANDLYIFGIFESNYPKLMEDINRAKDHCKVVIKDTKEEIEASAEGLTIIDPEEKPTDPLIETKKETDVEYLYSTVDEFEE